MLIRPHFENSLEKTSHSYKNSLEKVFVQGKKSLEKYCISCKTPLKNIHPHGASKNNHLEIACGFRYNDKKWLTERSARIPAGYAYRGTQNKEV